MGSPKHQHFIPKSYLKYFGNKQGVNYLVDTLMRGPGNKIVQLTTTNICVQKNLYTFPLNSPGDRFAIEKFYAVEVDAEYPKVYDMLINPNVTAIGRDDKRKILNTILSLFFRTPHFLNDRNDGLDDMLDRLIARNSNPENEVTVGLKGGQRMKFKMKDIEDVRASIKAKYKEEFLISHFADWQDFVNYKMTCGLEVITVPIEVPLITSDNPILIMGMDGQLNLKDIFHQDNIIEVPINRNQYVIIHPNSIAENERLRIVRSNRDKYFAAGVNLRIQDNSQTRLISCPGDLQVHFDSQAELGQQNENNLKEFEDLKKRTQLQMELMQVIKKNRTSICPEVANKVREIRKTKLMDDDVMLNQLIHTLAQNGYLTV